MDSTPPTPTVSEGASGAHASPSTGGQPVATHGPINGDYRVVRKRNRVPLSCAPCRTRKLKCNRSHPCENCVKRGDAGACSYASPSERRKNSTRSSGASTPDDMQNRIDRLESLVLTMMNHGGGGGEGGAGAGAAGPGAVNRTLSVSTPTNSGGSAASASAADFNSPSQPDETFHSESGESETDRVANSFGVLHVQNNKAAYLGEAHWGSILNGISEVRNYFIEHKKQYEEQLRKVEQAKIEAGNGFSGPAFLLGGHGVPELPKILSSLHGRDEIDKLVNRYFASYDTTAQIMHTPSWQRAYERHWNDPRSTSAVFLGQLFAICGLAMQSYRRDGDEPPEYRGRTLDLANNYRHLTQQCMLLFDINKVEHAIVETYVLHLQSEFYKNGDVDIGVWVLLGTVVRLAMRMGLHRDSRHYPDLSPFQGEMRRRLWTYIRLGDVLFSFQVGLPNMVRSSDCDTELPLNLHDEDFDEHSAALPPARPASVGTGQSYLIAKASLAFILGRIVECTHSVQPPAYEDIMRLDRELLAAFHGLPSVMHVNSGEPALNPDHDAAPMIICRFHLAILFNKSLCVLHRKFLPRARESARFAHSRRACLDAAMAILRYHALLHREARPGRPLAAHYQGALAHLKHDFILAGTLVCLDLHKSAQLELEGRGGAAAAGADQELWGADRRDEMTRHIEASRAIWAEQEGMIEAWKAYQVAGIMLQKIAAMRAQSAARVARGALGTAAAAVAAVNGGGTSDTSPSPLSGGGLGRAPEEPKPEQAAAMTLGMLSSGGLAGKPPPPSLSMQQQQQQQQQLAYQASPANSGGSPPNPANGLPPAAAAPSPPGGFGGFNAMGPGGFGNPAALPFLGPDTDLPVDFDWSNLDSFISDNYATSGMWPQGMDLSGPAVDGAPPGLAGVAATAPNLDPNLANAFGGGGPFAPGSGGAPAGFQMGPSL